MKLPSLRETRLAPTPVSNLPSLFIFSAPSLLLLPYVSFFFSQSAIYTAIHKIYITPRKKKELCIYTLINIYFSRKKKYIYIYICIYVGVKRRILLRYFCYLLRTALGDDATKVMVPSETEQPESLRDARDLWSVVTTTFYYFLSNAVSRAHARFGAGRREGSGSEAVGR